MLKNHSVVTLMVLTSLLAASPGWSAVFTVTTRADSGPGSLRNAILQAGGNGTPDTILFDPGLSGNVIRPLTSLPPIDEQPLLIDADIDNDGRPDVTLDGTATTSPA